MRVPTISFLQRIECLNYCVCALNVMYLMWRIHNIFLSTKISKLSLFLGIKQVQPQQIVESLADGEQPDLLLAARGWGLESSKIAGSLHLPSPVMPHPHLEQPSCHLLSSPSLCATATYPLLFLQLKPLRVLQKCLTVLF